MRGTDGRTDRYFYLKVDLFYLKVTKTVNAKVGISKVDDYLWWFHNIGFRTENFTRGGHKV